MTRPEVVARIEALLGAWKARNLDAMVSYLTEDVVWHDLGMWSPPAVGRDAVRRFSESLLRAFPDFQVEIRHPICVSEDGSCCVIPWTITATNLGPVDPPGFAPTGRRVRFDGMDFLIFRGEQVSRIETRFDPEVPMEQLLGWRLRPRSGSFLERCLVRAQRARAAWLRRKSYSAARPQC